MASASEQQSSESTSPASSPSPNGRDGGAPGEGIDRKIEKKTFTPKRIGLAAAALLVVGALAYLAYGAATGGRALNVERDKLTVSTVAEGPFQEFIAATGTVIPRRTVYLDVAEGGRVEEVFAQEGAMVEKGQPLLRLANRELQLQLMDRQAALSEQVSNLQEMRFQVEQSRIERRRRMMQQGYETQRLRREHKRAQKDRGMPQVEREEMRKEYEYKQRLQKLTRRAYRQDSLQQEARLDQMQTAVERMRRNLGAMEKKLKNLIVRAPVTGQLTSLDAEIGQIRGRGGSFGKIDVLDDYKVQAQIDEFYIERVQNGQTATTRPLDGERRALDITRVYPEVKGGQFRIDLAFQGATLEGLRRGQTIRFRLKLGSPEQAILLDRGGFYQSTGDNWVYVLNGDGEAVRRPVELGRQNPEHFEVLGGLEPGDRVVTSSYETFGDADRLVLN